MAGNENNPYAKDGVLKNPKPGEPGHRITIAELKEANHDGAPNPATVDNNRSDAEIMSGKEDRAGIPMTRAAAQATESNDAILAKQGEQEIKVGHVAEDGKFVRTPPNTPNI